MRAVGSGIKRWLETKYIGEKWTPHSAQVEMTANVRTQLRDQSGDAAVAESDSLVERGFPRIESLNRAPLLSLLGTEKVDEWMPLDRLEPHWVNRCRVYTIPDLIARIGEKWHLIRISSQIGRRIPTEQQQLELAVMLNWAVDEPTLPNDVNRFIIHRIGWLNHRWLGWRRQGNPTLAAASRVMLAQDLKELQFAHLCDPDKTDLETLATADNKKSCNTCGFKESCSQVG